MERSTRTRRYVGAALAVSLAATLATVGSVTAATNDDLTVSGASVAELTLALADDSAAFGNVTPGGTETGEGTLAGIAVGGEGSCFEWTDAITIQSNVIYDVEWVAAATNANLDFLTTDPGDYAACTGGATMSTTTADAFTNQAIPTTTTVHAYYLGLDVKWSDGVSGTIGAATITFTAVANA